MYFQIRPRFLCERRICGGKKKKNTQAFGRGGESVCVSVAHIDCPFSRNFARDICKH